MGCPRSEGRGSATRRDGLSTRAGPPRIMPDAREPVDRAGEACEGRRLRALSGRAPGWWRGALDGRGATGAGEVPAAALRPRSVRCRRNPQGRGNGGPNGIRTRVARVRTWYPRPLDDGTYRRRRQTTVARLGCQSPQRARIRSEHGRPALTTPSPRGSLECVPVCARGHGPPAPGIRWLGVAARPACAERPAHGPPTIARRGSSWISRRGLREDPSTQRDESRGAWPDHEPELGAAHARPRPASERPA